MSAYPSSVDTRQRLRQMVAFASVGAIATALQYGILVLTVEFLGLPPAVGSGVGYVISAAVNYILNYRLTFRSSRSHGSAVVRFAMVSGVGLLLNVGVMQVLTRHMHWQYLLAQVLTTGIVLIWTYTGSAFWTFAGDAGRGSAATRE